MQTQETQQELRPAQVRSLLEEGNRRFQNGQSQERDFRAQVTATSSGQYPMAVILGCIDSRASAELVFDQGIGDVFSARVAGNVLNGDLLGSMEFACKVAGSKLVVVLGHTACGAVKGACADVHLGNLTGLLKKVKPALDQVSEPKDAAQRTADNLEFVDAVARANVNQVIGEIRDQSPVLQEMEKAGEIEIVGAMYDVGSGGVEFFDR